MTTKKKNVSEKIDELKAGTDWFYQDDFVLDEASQKYRDLMNLAKEIERDLVEMKNEIKIIDEDFSKQVQARGLRKRLR